MTNRRVLLRNRPVGEPKPSDFEVVDAPLPEPQDGDILVRTIWLSLDPYMRGRMNDVKSYTAPVALGQPMVGGTVGEVVKSRDAAFTPVAGRRTTSRRPPARASGRSVRSSSIRRRHRSPPRSVSSACPA